VTEGLNRGIYEALLTRRLQATLDALSDDLIADLGGLANAEASDRLSRHVAALVARAVSALPEGQRSADGASLARQLIEVLQRLVEKDLGLSEEVLADPPAVLTSISGRRPDGSAASIGRPLTPLLDTAVLTNAPGEPSVAREVKAEVDSSDRIDVLMAFIRWSGVRTLIDDLRRHCEAGRPLRVLTTTYTNSTEQRALDELVAAGAEVRVSYDTSGTRLHAKSWMFHRASGYSTAYIGSSNLTHSAQQTGLEWNVRLAEARNPDAIAKMQAVFESYWAGRDFVPYDPEEFSERTQQAGRTDDLILSPVEVVLRPFQEELLERLELARHLGRHRNLLVSATGTGKTVMAAVDYARLRQTLPRSRLLFVAHREEILEQSRRTFAHVLRDASFGEKWVGGQRPSRFEHVFASVQSLNASGVERIDPDHFDVVVIDEFHHAAAESYSALLNHVQPDELLGLTATPERADGLDVLSYFGGEIAAELRLWTAIDQQYLSPFDYFGIHDGLDLRDVPWKRGRGYDVGELTNVFTADHAWANRVIEQVRQKIADPSSMRALGFCVSIDHARFMAERFRQAGLAAAAIWGQTPTSERQQALRDLASGTVSVVFTVDLFNEGVDVPDVDTILMLRPTESPTLFLQQLGRGLRKTHTKSSCTVLDFVGQHRTEFRYDRRLRSLLGGTRREIERQVEQGFPFLPAGCSMNLDAVARDIVLRSIRNALPNTWRDKVSELRSLGDVSLDEYLTETGLELADIYSGGHSWSEMCRQANLPTIDAGPDEDKLLRAAGRLQHVDDELRLDSYRAFASSPAPPALDAMGAEERRLLRMFVGSLTPLGTSASMDDALAQLWAHPQALAEIVQVLDVRRRLVDHLHPTLDLGAPLPLRAHARYTRQEILAAYDVGSGAKASPWQSGVWHAAAHQTDLFAFTLDKSSGGFSPTTRYRDYAISRDLIHWESQSTTAEASVTGQRYICHADRGSRVVLFARHGADDRAFWCLGTAKYVRHEGERPIAFVWRLDRALPADLFASFAAAVA